MRYTLVWPDETTNAHATIPEDKKVAAWAAPKPFGKILTTTARNYQLEAALESIAVQYRHLFHNPAAPTMAATSPQGKGEK
jgi:hypothetical protein